jgi:hypothetical protein
VCARVSQTVCCTADRADFRKVVIASILGTDMARHQELSDRIAAFIAARRRPSALGSPVGSVSSNSSSAQAIESLFDANNVTSREVFGITILKVRDVCRVVVCVSD